jgi:hypothetical protein
MFKRKHLSDTNPRPDPKRKHLSDTKDKVKHTILPKSLHDKLVDLYRAIQDNKSSQDLVFVCGKKGAIQKATQNSQLGMTEANVISKIPHDKSQEEDDSGWIVVFHTDESDPSNQPWGTRASSVVSFSSQ